MKKQIYLIIALAFLLISCEKSELDKLDINSNNETVYSNNETRYKGLKVKLPNRYNKDVLSLELSDLQNKFYKNNSIHPMRIQSASDTNMGITLEEITEIIDTILIQYPTLNNLTENDIKQIKLNFPDLSKEEIIKNIDVIEEFYTAFIRYELVENLGKLSPQKQDGRHKVNANYGYNYGYNLNSSEFWFLVSHPGIAKPIKEATDKAKKLTDLYFTGTSPSQTKADAFRHAIWNVLIAKYIGKTRSSIPFCIDRARTFTTLHETGTPKPANTSDAAWELDVQMDLHNNNQGLIYFEKVAWINHHKTWFYTIDRVTTPYDDEIAKDIKAKADVAKKIDSIPQINFYPHNLVHIK